MRKICPHDNQCNNGTCSLIHTNLLIRNKNICSFDNECTNEHCELTHIKTDNITQTPGGLFHIQRFKNLQFNSYEDADNWLKIHEKTLRERV